MILFLKFSQCQKHFGTLRNTNKECEDYDLKKSNYKSDKTILEFNQKNNDLIYQITASVVKDIPKKIRALAYSFKARKSLIRFDSILSLNFFRFYCIIILIVILIRLKEFSCVFYFSIYLDVLNLRLFISRKIVLLKNFS